MPEIKQARVIFNVEAIADLLLEKSQDGAVLRGLYLKRFNDFVRLSFFPQANLSPQTINELSTAIDGSIWLHADEEYKTKVFCLSVRGQEKSKRELRVPVFSSDIPPTYFNFECVLSERDTDVLVELNGAHPFVELSKDYGDREMLDLSNGQTVFISFSEGCSIHLTALGETYAFIVALRCIKILPSPTSLGVSYNDGRICISGKDGDLKAITLLVFIHPHPATRLLKGQRTAGVIRSRVIFALKPPINPRLLSWLTCAITSKLQIPIAMLPKLPPQPVIPNVLYFASHAEGWFVPPGAEDRLHLTDAEAVIMFGDVKEEFFRGLVEKNAYGVVALISDRKDDIRKALSSYFPSGLSLEPNKAAWSSFGVTKSVGLYVPDFIAARSELEELFIQIVQTAEASLPERVNEDWSYHINKRLKAIPSCMDLAVDIVCTLGNMLRGRLPDESRMNEFDYSALLDDDLWLIPRTNKSEIARSELISELNVRIISEYTAARAFSELCDASKLPNKTTNWADVLFEQRLAEVLYSWEVSAKLGDQERKSLRQRANEIIQKCGRGNADIMKAFARYFYENSSRLSNNKIRQRRDEGLSLVNPLVVVYAGGGEDAIDYDLQSNSSFWAQYAGALSAQKPGAIAPSFLPEEEMVHARELQTELRLHLHSFEGTEKELDTICRCRERLGDFVRQTSEPALYHLLDSVGADRIVSFSDICIDYMPFDKTILGLEYTISSFPASGSAYLVVSRALLGAYHVINRQKKDRVSILCTVDSSDHVSEWAKKLSDTLGESLRLVGLSSENPSEIYEEIESVLDYMADCPIVVFLGHGTASEHWAGVNLGRKWLSISDIGERNWADTFVFLIGCETAAIDTSQGNLAKEFLLGGARAVVGTTSKVRIDVAEVFLQQMIADLFRGLPADYAFFTARRKSCLYEVLDRKGNEHALRDVQALLESDQQVLPFHELLNAFSVQWQEAFRLAPYSLSFTLLGGVSHTLV